LALGVGDIDRHRMRIHVRGGKGNKDRSVPITQPLLGMLRKCWKTHENPRSIFPNPNGVMARMRAADTPRHAGGVQAAMGAAVADCGIRLHITVHLLGHLFATHRREMGVDLRELQGVLGHVHAATTARYAHRTDVSSA
jgi:integrase/recombinase XerD